MDGKVVELERRSEMSVMDETGDTKIIWDPDNEAEVDNARRTFEELVNKKKYTAFLVGSRGKKDEQVTKFDSGFEKLILVPPIQGG